MRPAWVARNREVGVKQETRIIGTLMLLSPALGELLSGSNPPLQFFNPLALAVLVLFYGGGALLIREARVRWSAQWSVLFLAAAYAIWEEGTTMQSFFNPNHAGLGPLAGYGLYGGVQWPWAVDMTFFHATMSILLPIAIVDLCWPAFRHRALLQRRGIVLASLGILLSRTALVGFMLSEEATKAHPYRPAVALVLGSLLVVIALIVLAYRLRGSVVVTHAVPLLPPAGFALAGATAQMANLLLPLGMASTARPASLTLLLQGAGILAILWFIRWQLLHRDATDRHRVALIAGSLFCYIAAAPVLEFGMPSTPKRGMTAVAVLALLLLLWWARHVLRGAPAVPSAPLDLPRLG